MRSLLIALVLGLLLFIVSSSFAFDDTESRMAGWLVGAAVFPVLPLTWHAVREIRRTSHADELAATTRFALRVVVISIVALGVALLIGRERVVRATTSHGWWWFSSPSATPTPTPTPPPTPIPTPPVKPPAPPPAPPLAHVARVDAGPRNVCLVTDAGQADCWGMGEKGQNGDGQTTDRSVPTRVPALDHVVDIAIGQTESCALLRDGTVECWGADHHTPAIVPDLTGVRQLGAGDAHVCALLADGTVRCWGKNDDGELGDGTKRARAIPAQVHGLSNVVQLAVGGRHTCARTAAGTVACWGVNDLAQLGSPGRPIHSPATVPLAVKTLAGVVDIAAGQNHTCVRFASSAVSCWGWDEECQLGFVSKDERCLGGSPCKAAPTAVPGLTDVAELALGAMHSCARQASGSVECWGDDPKQFLPDNTVDDKVPRACAPAVTEVHTATQVAVYWGGVCALLADNTISCWGSNWFGELGDGTTHAHPHPAPIVRRG